eukprot:11212751-Lingulodinium_polyedra.AAC.1
MTCTSGFCGSIWTCFYLAAMFEEGHALYAAMAFAGAKVGVKTQTPPKQRGGPSIGPRAWPWRPRPRP